MKHIKQVFDTAERDVAFLYLFQKVAETSTKKERLKIVKSVMDYICEEEEHQQEIKPNNIMCEECLDELQDDGTCLNCSEDTLKIIKG